MKRREFVSKSTMSALALSALPAITPNHLFAASAKQKIGMDAHAVRAMKWKATKLIDYAISIDADSLLFNGLNYFESLDDKYLKKIKKRLDKNDIKFYFGIGGLSKGSTSFKGNKTDNLILEGIRVAKIFDSSSVNCKIGSVKDRYTEGGIVQRMDEIINALLSMRQQIQDAGLKFAIENHAGDLRAEEVLQIVQTVGTDICGVMLDPGNSVWSMEDPMEHLQKLGKYALCSSLRDYRIWESENGASFQWTAVGEGSMDYKKYVQRMSELCPQAPLNVESISGRAIEIPFLTKDFWKGYPNLKALEMSDFLARIRKGESIEAYTTPQGKDKTEFEQEQQKKELIKSIKYLKQIIG
ncbi:MAG: TIM barrel protein [Cyclobacteriaceae bacterium]